MWHQVNLYCPPGHLLTYSSIHPFHPPFLQPPSPRLFPKAAYNPLHLQKLRTQQPAKSRACDLASTTTESGRKRDKCQEWKRGLSIEEDDERVRKMEKEGGRQREEIVVSGDIRHIENTLWTLVWSGVQTHGWEPACPAIFVLLFLPSDVMLLVSQELGRDKREAGEYAATLPLYNAKSSTFYLKCVDNCQSLTVSLRTVYLLVHWKKKLI